MLDVCLSEAVEASAFISLFFFHFFFFKQTEANHSLCNRLVSGCLLQRLHDHEISLHSSSSEKAFRENTRVLKNS